MTRDEVLVVGERVRIKTGVLQGIEDTLVRKNSCLRFVLTLCLFVGGPYAIGARPLRFR